MCKFILKDQGVFSLDVNKILRLQVTLNSRYAKNVIRYSFCTVFNVRTGPYFLIFVIRESKFFYP